MSTLRISIRDEQVYLDNKSLKLTVQKFSFFLRLSLAFVSNEGWCPITDMLGLPGWNIHKIKSSQRNIEKALDENSLSINGKRIIEKRPKYYHWRINKDVISNIEFEEGYTQISEWLYKFTISPEILEDRLWNKARLEIAEGAFATGNMIEAISQLHRFLKINPKTKNEELRAQTTIAYAQYELGRAEAAKTSLNHISKLVDNNTNYHFEAKYLARYYAILAAHENSFGGRGHEKRAKEHIEHASKYLRDTPEHYLEWGLIHRGLARLAGKRKNYLELETRTRLAIAMWVKASWWYGVDAGFYHMGSIRIMAAQGLYNNAPLDNSNPYSKENLVEEGIGWLKRSINIVESVGIAKDSSWCQLKLATAYRLLGRVETAKSYLGQAKVILIQANDNLEWGYYYYEYSEIYRMQQEYLLAADALSISEQCFLGTNYHTDRFSKDIEILKGLGKTK